MDNNYKIPDKLLDKEVIANLHNTINNFKIIPSPDDVNRIKVLDVDLDGTLKANYVTEEVHTMDVPNHQTVIQFDAGSFYLEDLKLTLVSTGQELVKNTDYVVVGMNYGKTKITRNTSAVWDFILVISPIVGDIAVEYRAFGGQVTRLNVEDIKSMLIEILTAIKHGEFIRCDDLKNCPTIIHIEEEINDMSHGSKIRVIVLTDDVDLEETELRGNVWLSNRGSTCQLTAHLPAGDEGYCINAIVEANQFLRMVTRNNEIFTFQGMDSAPNGYIRSNEMTNNWTVLFTGSKWMVTRTEGPLHCDE